MRWFRRRAVGGMVPQRRSEGVPVLLSRGVAVVPDAMDKDLAARINGGETDVYTVSEWIAAQDEEASGNDAR